MLSTTSSPARRKSQLFAAKLRITSSRNALQKWKDGKRKAEKDPHVAAQFFKLIQPDASCPGDSCVCSAPRRALTRRRDNRIKTFAVFSKELDRVVNVCFVSEQTLADRPRQIFMAALLSHGERLSNNIAKEFGRFGTAFIQLSETIAASGEIDGRLSPHPPHPVIIAWQRMSH